VTAAGHYRGGAGTPLVLLHGATGSWRIWRPVLPMLEAAHEVYAPTLPGHRGGRRMPRGPAGPGEIADVLEAQLDEAGIPVAHLAGNSLGGAVALELARRGRASSVVAIAPSGGWRSKRDRERLVLLTRITARVVPGRVSRLLFEVPMLRRTLLRTIAEHGDRVPAEELRELMDDAAGCVVLDDIAAACRRDGLMRTLDSIGCPVRIAWPQHDRTLPYRRYGAPLVARIPGAEVITLPGVGHVPMYDDPELVARSILHVTTAADAAAQNAVQSPRRGATS
jgi:pimeloyl-ACP methyl ester carboxylesterase